MSKDNEHQHPFAVEAWRKTLDAFWRDKLEADDLDFDVELVAAHAEGSLDGDREVEAIATLARSPRALQCFLAVRDQWNEDHLAAQSSASHAGAVSIQGRSGESKKRANREIFDRASDGEHLRSRLAYFSVLALAASLLLVLTTGWIGWTNSLEVASLRQQQTELSQELQATKLNDFLKQKEIAHLLASERGAKYLSGKLTPELVETTLLRFPRPRGRVVTPSEMKIYKVVPSYLKASIPAAGQAIGKDQEQEIEQAFAELVSGDLERAELLLESLKRQSPSAPQVLNLQAVTLLYRAETHFGESSNLLVAEAESVLKQVAEEHPGFDLAWLNLALLAEYEYQDAAAASEYWSRFLQLQTDPAVRSRLRDRLEILQPQ